MKKTCNNCSSRNCNIWERTADNKLKHKKSAWYAVMAEKMNLLTCHESKKSKWRFTDLVSRVTIINPNSPVIGMLAKYV